MKASLGKLLNLLAATFFILVLNGNTEGGCVPPRDLEGISPDEDLEGEDGEGAEDEAIAEECEALEEELAACFDYHGADGGDGEFGDYDEFDAMHPCEELEEAVRSCWGDFEDGGEERRCEDLALECDEQEERCRDLEEEALRCLETSGGGEECDWLLMEADECYVGIDECWFEVEECFDDHVEAPCEERVDHCYVLAESCEAMFVDLDGCYSAGGAEECWMLEEEIDRCFAEVDVCWEEAEACSHEEEGHCGGIAERCEDLEQEFMLCFEGPEVAHCFELEHELMMCWEEFERCEEEGDFDECGMMVEACEAHEEGCAERIGVCEDIDEVYHHCLEAFGDSEECIVLGDDLDACWRDIDTCFMEAGECFEEAGRCFGGSDDCEAMFQSCEENAARCDEFVREVSWCYDETGDEEMCRGLEDELDRCWMETDQCFMEADRCFGDDGHGEECEGIEMFCIELENEFGRCLEESPEPGACDGFMEEIEHCRIEAESCWG